MTSQLFFVALPLLLIFGATFITMVCQRTDKGMSRFQKFFVLIAAYSMVVFVLGFFAPSVLALFVPRNYPATPGSASEYARLTPRDIERIGNYPVSLADPEGPKLRDTEGLKPLRDGGQYYFFSRKGYVFTAVSKETFERALYWERLAWGLTRGLWSVSAVTWVVSLLILLATKRYFLTDSETDRHSKESFAAP
jgi:hypothetical protein